MTYHEIFNLLADNEEKLFYASCADTKNLELKEAHKAAKLALETFARATGCHNKQTIPPTRRGCAGRKKGKYVKKITEWTYLQ